MAFDFSQAHYPDDEVDTSEFNPDDVALLEAQDLHPVKFQGKFDLLQLFGDRETGGRAKEYVRLVTMLIGDTRPVAVAHFAYQYGDIVAAQQLAINYVIRFGEHPSVSCYDCRLGTTLSISDVNHTIFIVTVPEQSLVWHTA